MFEDFNLKNFIRRTITGAIIVGAAARFIAKDKIMKKLDKIEETIYLTR